MVIKISTIAKNIEIIILMEFIHLNSSNKMRIVVKRLAYEKI